MGRRGRGMGGGGRRSGGFSGGRRSGGSRRGIGGGRGRSGRGQAGRSTGRNTGGFGGGYRRRRGFGSWLPWFMLGRMGGGRRRGDRGGGGCGGCGCLLPIIVIAIFGFLFMGGQNSNNNITTQNNQVSVRESTVEREPISEGLVNETSYYTDQANWIVNENELLPGLEYFYDETNIQPHLFITDSIDGETNPIFDDVEAYTHELYDQLFDDEAHLLVVFFENDAYDEQVSYHASVGEDAAQIFDDEAMNILFDYLDYYYTSDLSEEQYFSTVFEETADSMMDTSSGVFGSSDSSSDNGINWGNIGTGVVITVAVIVIIVVIVQKRQQSEEAEIIDNDDDMSF